MDRTELSPLTDSTTPRPPSTSRRVEPTSPSRTVQPTVRRGRFFGLFPGPVVVPPTALNSRVSPDALSPGRSSRTGGDELDPLVAAQAALKGRIEKQARSSVGDRARSIEVQVDQKSATVQARGVKFYQKRAVRKALESLPALSGLRSTIEVLD